jgi:hypothetical protein
MNIVKDEEMQYPTNYSPDHCRKGIVLNGLPLGGNTEGGRLQKQLMYTPVVIPQKGNGAECGCLAKKLGATVVNATITQSESSRATQLALGCSGTVSGVTAARVAELMASRLTKRNFGSEGVRIARQQQATLSCSTGSSLPNPIILQVCPPLPPPPGPPAPTCILAKNQKY